MTTPLTREQQRLVERSLPTVKQWVRIFAATWPRIGREELESVAYLEITECARTYDPERGPFGAYIRLPVQGAMMNTAMGATYSTDARVRAAVRAFARDEETEISGAEALDAALDLSPRDPRAELRGSLRNRATTFVTAMVLENETATNQADTAARYQAEQRREALQRAIATLPEEEREVIVAFHEKEETLDQIAARRGVVKRTVSRWHDRAKTHLAELMKDWAPEA